MAGNQVDQEVRRGWWRHYFIIGFGILFTVLVVSALVYFWDEMQDAAGYGYAGGFLVSVMAGVTIIPAPALPVIFTLGHKLSPLYVGLVAGLGEALGGITVYLTGAGGGTIWSKLRSKQPAVYGQPGSRSGATPLLPRELQSRQQVFFDHVMAPMRRWGGFWPVFIASAMVFSPFYLVGLGAGALGIGLKKFFLISWAGKTVQGLYVAFAGQWGL